MVRKKKRAYTNKYGEYNGKRTKKWYDNAISESTLEAFFKELKEARNFYIEEHSGIEHWDTEVVRKKKFVPKGVVIHTSGMKTLRETLHSNNSGLYSSHFIIPSRKITSGLPQSKFPLLYELPSSIIMPFDIDTFIHHSGYLSPVTWGIELRSLGQLRPSEENFVPSMFTEEIDYYNMRSWKRKALYYFSRGEGWTEKHEGPVYTWEGYHYEKFTQDQYLTLCVLIKCLSMICKMNSALVIPSSCIRDAVHTCPIIPIDFIQKKVSILETKDPKFTMEPLYKFTDNSKLFIKGGEYPKYEFNENIDDTRLIEDRVKENAWRNSLDQEKLLKVFKHGDVKFLNIFHNYKKTLESMGYFVWEKYFTKSLQIYANARDIELEEDALAVALESDYYNLVNGVYID